MNRDEGDAGDKNLNRMNRINRIRAEIQKRSLLLS
jgi:hypothetical protein